MAAYDHKFICSGESTRTKFILQEKYIRHLLQTLDLAASCNLEPKKQNFKQASNKII